jgi:hypothetical protein
VLGLVERAILFYIDHAPQWLLRVKKNPPAVSCHDGLCLASLLLSSRTAEWVCLCRLLLCRQVSCLCRPSASSSRFCGPHLSHHLCLSPLLMSNHAGTRVGVGFLFRRRLGTHCHASRTVRAPAAVPSLRASSPSAEPARSPRQRHKERESLTRAPSILQVGSRWHAWRVRAVPARRGRARCALRQRPPLRPRSHLPRRHFVRTSRVKRPPAARPARRQRARLATPHPRAARGGSALGGYALPWKDQRSVGPARQAGRRAQLL